MAENIFRIAAFDPLKADDALWTAHYDHAAAIHREIDPEDPVIAREKYRALLLAAFKAPYVNRYLYLALTPGGEAAGTASVAVENPASPSYKENKHAGNMNLSVLPEYRRQGLGRRLLERIVTDFAAKEPAVTEFMSPVVLEAGKRCLDHLGGTVSLVQAENRLYFKDTDWAMVERWAEEGARRNPSSSVVNTNVIPEADINDFAEVYSETMNQQPFGDISIKITIKPEQIRVGEAQSREIGQEHTTIYIREADGSVSGITETAYLKESPHKVRQLLTGVRAKYRGRGLGKFLKALMLLDIRARHPGVKYVVTANADSNAPMMAINNALGFKKHLPVLLYKLKLEAIK